jgi:hypothetical protein
MKRKLSALLVVLILAAVLLGRTHAAGGLAIDWWSVDGGGNRSSGGAYVFDGSIGQPDVGGLSSARFSANGGFWFVTSDGMIYLPLMVR